MIIYYYLLFESRILGGGGDQRNMVALGNTLIESMLHLDDPPLFTFIYSEKTDQTVFLIKKMFLFENNDR